MLTSWKQDGDDRWREPATAGKFWWSPYLSKGAPSELSWSPATHIHIVVGQLQLGRTAARRSADKRLLCNVVRFLLNDTASLSDVLRLALLTDGWLP